MVLASTPDMECGFSRELFLQWAPKSCNSIIITNRLDVRICHYLFIFRILSYTTFNIICRSPPGTLARSLLDLTDSNRTMQLLVRRRIRLEGSELQEYQKKEKQESMKIKKDEFGSYYFSTIL